MHPQLTPHKYFKIKYGAKLQLNSEDDIRTALNASGIKWIQWITGALFYYAQIVNNNLLVALSGIGAQQANDTEDTGTTIKQLLNYVATYPKYSIFYHASDMVLAAQFDDGF